VEFILEICEMTFPALGVEALRMLTHKRLECYAMSKMTMLECHTKSGLQVFKIINPLITSCMQFAMYQMDNPILVRCIACYLPFLSSMSQRAIEAMHRC
jgi:hypothetical protein